MPVIDEFDARFQLGVSFMDQTHREFVQRLARLEHASAHDFPLLFRDLVEHTTLHFSTEEAAMTSSAFPATAEHREEHARVLGEMHRIAERVAGGRTAFARAYLRDRLPEWFTLHAVTMDSALATHLQRAVCGSIETRPEIGMPTFTGTTKYV